MKKVAILGSGESGVGAALLAKAKGYYPFVSDFGAINEKYRKILQENQIEFEEGKHTEESILNAVEVIKSPGIPDKSPIVKKAAERGIPVISELEFAYRYSKGKMILISGTNGKTTTTLLTYHLLKEAGCSVALAGNVGHSLAKLVVDDQYEYYVIEVSSFQLDGMFTFKANIAVLLNITPDHLDRYDYNFKNYIDSKFRIVRNMTATDSFVYFTDDEVIDKEIKRINIHSQHFPISIKNEIENGAYLQNEKLIFNTMIPEDDKFILPVSDVSIQGKHNNINTMAAVLVARICGIDWSSIRKSLKNFKNASHRLEPVAEIKGVKFINDSKATNVDSVYYALESFKQPLVWIAGGTDKGNDYNYLKDVAKEKVKTLVCLGKDNEKLIRFFSSEIPQIIDTHDIKDAVKKALQASAPGDVVLLSPACASFDLFKNYEDRGDKFKAAVLDLKKEVDG